MNAVWTIIMISGIVTLIFVNPDGAARAMTAGANDAVTLTFTLIASYSLWLGLFTLIEKTGISDGLARLLKKPIKFLFPDSGDEARKYITMNVAANFLGLGNAATPLGISAVGAMRGRDDRATPDMIMFLVVSSTSLQFLPSTVIAMRISRNSHSPASFLPACVAATIFSTLIGIVMAKILNFLKRKKCASILSAQNKNDAQAEKA